VPYYIIYLDCFKLEHEQFQSKEEALERIGWLLKHDDYLSQEKIMLFQGEMILLDINDSRTITVTEYTGD